VSNVGDLVGGRYRLGKRLGGEEGIGVFAAEDLSLRRDVVLKIATPEAEPALKRQARCLTSLQFDTSNVVPVVDEGVTPDGGRYLVTTLIDGTRLDTLATRRGPLDADEAASIGVQLLDAALAARRVVPDGLGTVPASAILDRDGLLRVTRFRDREADDPHDPTVAETAAILHELLTGVAPHAGESVADHGRDVPHELAEVVDAALAGQVATTEEFRRRLADARRRLPQPVEPAPPPLRGWQVVAAVVVLAVTILVIALAVAVW
jgi:hypothetical protein